MSEDTKVGACEDYPLHVAKPRVDPHAFSIWRPLILLQPDVKPDVAGGSEHVNLKVTGQVSLLPPVHNTCTLSSA